MKRFLAPLFTALSLFALSVGAFSAPQHSWFVATIASSSDPNKPGKEQRMAIRDDGKIRRPLPPPQSSDHRVFSPDGKHWLEVKYDSGFSVASSRKYLIVGAKDETDKDKKPFNDLYVESAEWTPTNNILLSSGYADWGSGTQVFAYSIIDPITAKEVINLKPFREGIFGVGTGKYERDAALSPDESRLLFVAQCPAFGNDAFDFLPDHNDYLICFPLKAGRSQVVASFKAIGRPQWNSTGTNAIFSACTAWSRDGNSAPANVYLYFAEDDQLRQFTFSPFANSSPTWSPDGKRIAWISNRPLKKGDKPDKNRLYTMNADGTNQKLLAPDIVNFTAIRWQKDEPK